jgi:ATP-binding cassette, subfamily C, bacterial CydD
VTTTEKIASSTSAERRWLAEQAAAARAAGLAAAVAGTGMGLLQIAQAWLIASAIASVAAGGLPFEAVTALVAVVAGRSALAWVWDAAGAAAAARVKADLRGRLYRHVAGLGPGFVAGRGSGSLSAALMEEVEALDGYVARYRPQAFVAAAVPVAILAAVFPVDWVAGALLALSAPIVPLLMAVAGAGAASESQRQFQALARMSGHFLDRLQGLVTLRLLGRAEAELASVGQVADEFRRRTMSVLRLAFLSSAVLEFFTAVAIAMIAIYVGFAFLGWISFGPAPEMTLRSGLFVLLLAPEFFQPLRQLSAFYHDRAAAMGAARELMPILAATPHAQATGPGLRPLPASPAASRPSPPPGPAGLRLEDVHVTHAGRAPALRGVSFAVSPGEHVALVGPSGSGKTTVLNLLLGFVPPERGRALIGGTPVGLLDDAALRRLVTWVGQTRHLFEGTLRDNIRLGAPDASDAEIWRAAALAHVADFAAALPGGLDTQLGERGFGLSGGQVQRVALARAFLSPAPILLMDEPTASLDAGNEALVLDSLTRLAEGRTVLVATHSPAVAAWADRAVRLDGGRILAEAAA